MLTRIDPKDWPSRKKIHKLVKAAAHKAEAERVACKSDVAAKLMAAWRSRLARASDSDSDVGRAEVKGAWCTEQCRRCGKCSDMQG